MARGGSCRQGPRQPFRVVLAVAEVGRGRGSGSISEVGDQLRRGLRRVPSWERRLLGPPDPQPYRHQQPLPFDQSVDQAAWAGVPAYPPVLV
eukprot:7106646-Alexandrium_andersonii.AAC.1